MLPRRMNVRTSIGQNLICVDTCYPLAKIFELQMEALLPTLIRDYLHDVGSELAVDAADLPIDQLAMRMKIAGGPPEALFPKNVGLLFFNPHPERFFPATQIDVVYFPEGAGGGKCGLSSFL